MPALAAAAMVESRASTAQSLDLSLAKSDGLCGPDAWTSSVPQQRTEYQLRPLFGKDSALHGVRGPLSSQQGLPAFLSEGAFV